MPLLKNRLPLLFFTILAVITLLGCRQAAPESQPVPGEPVRISLAEVEKNFVRVTVELEMVPGEVQGILSATFTPLLENFHLYSKDLPLTGLDGVGRPTLLELTESSRMAAVGDLTANVDLIVPVETADGTQAPPVYPSGPVTLSLPVSLPAGDGENVPDELAVTYMVCSGMVCKPPVMALVIPVEVPTFNPEP